MTASVRCRPETRTRASNPGFHERQTKILAVELGRGRVIPGLERDEVDAGHRDVGHAAHDREPTVVSDQEPMTREREATRSADCCQHLHAGTPLRKHLLATSATTIGE